MNKMTWTLACFLLAMPAAYGAEYDDFSRQNQAVPIDFPAYFLAVRNLPYEVFDTHVVPRCGMGSIAKKEKQKPFVKVLCEFLRSNLKVKLRDAKNKKLLHTFNNGVPNGSWNDNVIKFSVDLVGGTTTPCCLRDVNKEQLVCILPNTQKAKVTAVAFSADRTKIVSGSSTGVIKVWNAITGQVVAMLNGNRGSSIIDLWLKDDTIISYSSGGFSRLGYRKHGQTLRQWYLPGIVWAESEMTLPQYGLIKSIQEFGESCKRKELPLSLSVLAWRLLGLDATASVEDKDAATTEVAALFNSIPANPRRYLMKEHNVLPGCLSESREPRALCVVGETEIKKKRRRRCIVS